LQPTALTNQLAVKRQRILSKLRPQKHFKIGCMRLERKLSAVSPPLCRQVRLLKAVDDIFSHDCAKKSWRRLDGHNQLPKLVIGVTFNDGIEVIAKPIDHQPLTAAA
jgi:hypothetical protein